VTKKKLTGSRALPESVTYRMRQKGKKVRQKKEKMCREVKKIVLAMTKMVLYFL